MLIRKASERIARSSSAPIRWRVSAVSGTASTTKCAQPSSSCRASGPTTCSAPATGLPACRRITRTCMPSAAALRDQRERRSARRRGWRGSRRRARGCRRGAAARSGPSDAPASSRNAAGRLRAKANSSASTCSGMQISCRPVEFVRITSLSTSAGNRLASIPADAEWIQRSRLACAKSGSGKLKPKKTVASPISAARLSQRFDGRDLHAGKRRSSASRSGSGIFQ